ncbi:MAG: hypothetical protein QOH61_908 [Chloroflexota bacterium]|nr:hypothetical protein [Chloroflexota bacterium]
MKEIRHNAARPPDGLAPHPVHSFQTLSQALSLRSRLASLRGSWWAIPAVIAVASRLWGSGLVYAFGQSSWTGFHFPPAAGPATTWDGAWYLSIARSGYHADALLHTVRGDYHDFAFWPAWPTLLAPVLRLVPEAWADVSASFVANTLAVVGLVLWARVLEPAFGRRNARWGMAFVAFAPSSFVLSMAYSEPLFLLVSAAFFLSPARSLRRPLMAALAQATRVTGFATGATAIPDLVRSRGRDGRAWLILVAPLLVFAAWWLFIAQLTGDPQGFLQGTPSWLRVTGQESGPLSFLPDLRHDDRYFRPLVIAAVFLVGVIAGAVLLFRRGLSQFGWYAVAGLLPTLLLASWQSMPRHALIVVPAVAAAISPLRDRWRVVLLVLSALAEIVVCEGMVGIRLISP